jgi:hypothetical protein
MTLLTNRRHFLGATSALALTSIAATHAATTSSWGARIPTGDVHDFDFFIGKWQSANRRLKKRWVGSKDWDEFPSSLECVRYMGGIVNVEEVDFPTQGWHGMTVRTFSLEQRQWSIYWINSKTGDLFPPVVGGFTGDHGVFYGDDTDDGIPVKVVFNWTRLGPNAARWQQDFSKDGGKTWETNWSTEHKRVA